MSIECVSVSEANRLIYQMEPRRLAKELCDMTKEIRELRTKNENFREILENMKEIVGDIPGLEEEDGTE